MVFKLTEMRGTRNLNECLKHFVRLSTAAALLTSLRGLWVKCKMFFKNILKLQANDPSYTSVKQQQLMKGMKDRG